MHLKKLMIIQSFWWCEGDNTGKIPLRCFAKFTHSVWRSRSSLHFIRPACLSAVIGNPQNTAKTHQTLHTKEQSRDWNIFICCVWTNQKPCKSRMSEFISILESAADKTISPQGSSCFGAFDHITWSSLADWGLLGCHGITLDLL